MVSDIIVRLLGRNLSDDTFAMMTAFLVFVLEGPEKGKHSAPSFVRSLFVATKAEFAKYKRLGQTRRVDALPGDPERFRLENGDIYAAVYPSGPPVPCKLQLTDLNTMAQRVQRRESNRTMHALQPFQQAPNMTNMMQQFASMIQQQMRMGHDAGSDAGGLQGFRVHRPGSGRDGSFDAGSEAGGLQGLSLHKTGRGRDGKSGICDSGRM